MRLARVDPPGQSWLTRNGQNKLISFNRIRLWMKEVKLDEWKNGGKWIFHLLQKSGSQGERSSFSFKWRNLHFKLRIVEMEFDSIFYSSEIEMEAAAEAAGAARVGLGGVANGNQSPRLANDLRRGVREAGNLSDFGTLRRNLDLIGEQQRQQRCSQSAFTHSPQLVSHSWMIYGLALTWQQQQQLWYKKGKHDFS